MSTTPMLKGESRTAGTVALHVPRLADFRVANRSTLVSPAVLGLAVKALEALLVLVSGFAVARGYVHPRDIESSWLYVAAMSWTAVFTVAIFQIFGLYKPQALTGPLPKLPRLVLGWTIAHGVLVMIVFFLKVGPELSRVWLALWYGLGGCALVVDRLVLALITRAWIKQGRLTRRAVIYGGGDEAKHLIARLEADAESDIRICGVFDERDSTRVDRVISGYPVLGKLEELVAFGRKTRVDLVIVNMPLSAYNRINQVLGQLAVLPVDVRLSAVNAQLRFCSRTYSFIGSSPMIDLADKPLNDWGSVAKWAFDKTVGAIALLLLSPVLAAVAIAVRLDSPGRSCSGRSVMASTTN